MWRRIIFDCGLVLVAFAAPWWVSFFIALLAVVLFNQYIEFIILGLVLDSLYNAPVHRFHDFQLVLTLAAGIIFVIITYIKTTIRFER